MREKQEIKHGSVLEIPLSKNYGFAYCQILLFRNPILFIFNHFSKESLVGKIEVEELLQKPLFQYPVLLTMLPPLRGNKKWYKISDAAPIIDYSPDFGPGPILPTQGTPPDDFPVGVALCGILDPGFAYFRYDACKHLPEWTHYNPHFLVEWLTMSWILKNGDTIENIYEGDDLSQFALYSAKGRAPRCLYPNFIPTPGTIYKVIEGAKRLTVAEANEYHKLHQQQKK